MNDINIDVDRSKGDESTSGSSGAGAGGGIRKTITVKREYGTEQIPPDTRCQECGTRAIGVVVIESDYTDQLGKSCEPLCSNHKRSRYGSDLEDVRGFEWRRFVDA